MPGRDSMTGSPFSTNKNYEGFRDPILMEQSQFTGRKETRHNGVPKHSFAKHKGEHHGKFHQFADNVQQLRNKVQHHM